MNLTGQFLISMPSLQDERFEKTVIYMCAHSKDGAMGIIINKKIDFDLYPDLLEQLGIDKPLLNKKLYSLSEKTINFHPSLLPSYRGWYPHVHNIIDKTQCGVTLHELNEGADTGKIWIQKINS